MKEYWTEEELPKINVKLESGQVVTAIVKGRCLPFAQVYFCNGGHCEASWATIKRLVKTGEPLNI